MGNYCINRVSQYIFVNTSEGLFFQKKKALKGSQMEYEFIKDTGLLGNIALHKENLCLLYGNTSYGRSKISVEASLPPSPSKSMWNYS